MEKATSVEYASEDPVPDSNEISCDLFKVHDCMSTGLNGADDVDLAKYLIAYKELYNFFVLLGGAFSFVASDVKTKIKILEDYQAASKNGEFATVLSMMKYEMDNKMLEDKKYVSGSRTLLRLHRGMDFLQQFLEEVYKLEDDVKTSGVCREAYDRTLGNFHPWTIRKAAQLAMKLLPIKKELVRKITKDDASLAERTQQLMPDMLKAMTDVYKRVDDLYTTNKLHELP